MIILYMKIVRIVKVFSPVPRKALKTIIAFNAISLPTGIVRRTKGALGI